MRGKETEEEKKGSMNLPSPSLALEMKEAVDSSTTSLLPTSPTKSRTLAYLAGSGVLLEEARPHSPFSRQEIVDGKYRQKLYAQGVAAWKKHSHNMDRLLELLYDFYRGGGRQSIMLELFSQLAMVFFVVHFGIFLGFGVDWSFLYRPATSVDHPRLWQVIHWPRMPFLLWLAWLVFMAGLVVEFIRTIRLGNELREMEAIYQGLLGFNLTGLPNLVDFDAVIGRLGMLSLEYPELATGMQPLPPLDAYTVCNRLMRRDNYLIALFNRNVLHVEGLTRQLEWNLNMCLVSFVFDEKFCVRKRFTRSGEKQALARELSQRFQLMAIINLILAPVIMVYLLFYFFLKYAEQLYREPTALGQRSYSRLARWRFREYNELGHYFEERLEQSHRPALKFLDQFHNGRLVTCGRLGAFVAGSFLAVLLVISLLNEDLLMHFELTPGKSPIWYLSVLGLILAGCRAVLPDSTRRHDARRLLTRLTECTHYYPPHWHGLTAGQIAHEYKELFRYRFVGIGEDFWGLLKVPYLLYFELPRRSEEVIDFFREFTVHVDGLGYVCSFALFDLGDGRAAGINMKRNNENILPEVVVEEGKDSVEKMERSLFLFCEHHPKAKQRFGWQGEKNKTNIPIKVEEKREDDDFKDDVDSI